MKRRILSTILSLALVFNMAGVAAFAQDVSTTNPPPESSSSEAVETPPADSTAGEASSESSGQSPVEDVPATNPPESSSSEAVETPPADSALCPNHGVHDADCGGLDGACTHSCDECTPVDSGTAQKPKDTKHQIVLVSFPALAEDVARQNKPVGTPLAELNLPASLDAVTDADTTVQVKDVLWQSQPEYTPETAGTYAFTAALPGDYVLKDPAIALPVIEVTLGNQIMTGTCEPETMEFHTAPSRAGRSISSTLGDFTSFGAQLTSNSKTIHAQLKASGMTKKVTMEFTNPAGASFTAPNDTNAKEQMTAYLKTNHYRDFFDAMAAIDRDQPEIFWLANSQSVSASYSFAQSGSVYTCTILTLTFEPAFSEYTTTTVGAVQTAVNSKIGQIVAAAPTTSNYDTIKYFHDWLVNNNTYNTAAADSPSPSSNKPWELVSALLSSGQAADGPVCEGYARAFKALCDDAGITCILVSGTGNGGAHMWNYVKLDGAWYPVDVTWDDPTGGPPTLRHLYFLSAGGAFDSDHSNNGNFSDNSGTFQYPALNTAAYVPPNAKAKVTGAPTVSGTCTYGQKLSVLTLEGADVNFKALDGSTVHGTLAWQEPNKLYDAGAYNAVWIFTPTDANKYETLSGSISIEVDELLVQITIGGDLTPTYDGLAHGVTVSCTASDPTKPIPAGVTPKTTITYNGSTNKPVNAATYSVVATMNDPNFIATDAKASLVIGKKTLTLTPYTLSIAAGYTVAKKVPVTQFGIPANLAAKTSVTVTSDTDSILAAAPAIAGGDISVTIKAGAQVGQSAQLAVAVADGNHTVVSPAVLTVQVAEEGYTFTLIGAPTTVKLGENLNLTGFQIKTAYDSGRPATTDAVTAAMLSGYDKTATGAGSIGKKTITLKLDAKRQTSFVVDVLDVTTDFVVTPPTMLDYRWGIDTKLNLAGGTVLAVKRSGIAQTAVPMTAQMLSITDATFKGIGDFPVTVTYDGFKKTNVFTIKVRSSGNVTDTPRNLTDGTPGVAAELPKGATDSDRNKLLSLTFKIEPSSNTEFAQALKSMAGFMELDVKLVDSEGNIASLPKGTKFTLALPYPSGTDNTYEFKVMHLVNGTMKSENHTKASGGLRITVESFSPFAVGYQKRSGGTSSGSSSDTLYSYTSEYDGYDFWMNVEDKITRADDGDVIKVNAKTNEKMPESVMAALRKNSGVTLVISWSGGKTITIPAGKAAKQESGRIYYPLSLLVELYQGIEFVETPTDLTKLNPETGGGNYIAYADGKQIPVTGGSPLVIDAPEVQRDTINPPTVGDNAITTPDKNFEADAFAGTPDAKRANGGIWFAVAAAMLAAVAGVGVWFWRKKQEEQ